MRLLYFDCIAGISGDMALGALIDAGADLGADPQGSRRLPVEPFELEVNEVETGGIRATKVNVARRPRAHPHLREHPGAAGQAELPLDAKAMAQRIFRRLAEAEAMVHRARWNR